MIFFGLKNTPEEVGLPSVEKLDKTASADEEHESPELSKAISKRCISELVFKNPVIWIIALSNFFVYIIRFTILDWGSSILTQFKGLDITLTASVVEAILLATLWKQPATAYGRLEKITAECRKENP